MFEDRDPGELKILAGKILESYPDTIILFGAKTAGKATLLFQRSEELDGDMGKLIMDACQVIDGHGGGRPQQAQGGGMAPEKLDLALKKSYESLLKNYFKSQ